MSYNDFKLDEIRDQFSLLLSEKENLFSSVQGHQASNHLKETLKDNVPLAIAINTEKARSELIVAPVLVETVKILNHEISLFSGIELNVDSDKGLNGICDFIISLSNEQLFLDAPIITVVEAKNDNIKSGFGQCISEMIASKLFNENKKNKINYIYGVITTGSLWKFLKLNNNCVWIDIEEYHISNISMIIGILVEMVSSDKKID